MMRLFTRVIKLGDPGPVMEVTQDVGVILGDRLTARDQETPAARAVLLQGPAVRAVIGVLRNYISVPSAPLCVTHSILTWARV